MLLVVLPCGLAGRCLQPRRPALTSSPLLEPQISYKKDVQFLQPLVLIKKQMKPLQMTLHPSSSPIKLRKPPTSYQNIIK
jgi:hypothetical protein